MVGQFSMPVDINAVAEAHGGRVKLESEVGKGSTFRLILPIDYM